MWHLGRQTVGIVTKTATALSEFHEPTEPTESVAWVRNCLFEIVPRTRPKTAEDETGGTVVTHRTAEVFLPVNGDGRIPAFDAQSGGSAIDPIDPATITAAVVIRYDRDYEMRGAAVLEEGITPASNHVSILCEDQAG